MEVKEQDEITAVAVCRVVRQHLDQVREQCPDPTDYEQFAEVYDMEKSKFLTHFPRHKFFWIKFAEFYAETWTESAVSFVARAEEAHYDQRLPVLVESEALLRDICRLFEKNKELYLDNKNLWKDNQTLHRANEELLENVTELSTCIKKLMEANDALMDSNRRIVNTFE